MKVIQENIDIVLQEIEDLEEDLNDVRAACVVFAPKFIL